MTKKYYICVQIEESEHDEHGAIVGSSTVDGTVLRFKPFDHLNKAIKWLAKMILKSESIE